MTVGSDHHGDLDALGTESGDAPGPFSFDYGSPFQPEAKLGEELNGGIEVLHHDADVVHTLDCHAVSLASNALVRTCCCRSRQSPEWAAARPSARPLCRPRPAERCLSPPSHGPRATAGSSAGPRSRPRRSPA